MSKPYFVMLYSQNGEILIPLLDKSNQLMRFSTIKEAKTAGENTILGAHYGCSVFDELDNCDWQTILVGYYGFVVRSLIKNYER